MERKNAMHVELPEKVDLITVDVGWTKQEKVIPNVLKNLKRDGKIIVLVKPHYESLRKEIYKGLVKPEFIPDILERVDKVFKQNNLKILNKVESPIEGKKGGNKEWLYLLEN